LSVAVNHRQSRPSLSPFILPDATHRPSQALRDPGFMTDAGVYMSHELFRSSFFADDKLDKFVRLPKVVLQIRFEAEPISGLDVFLSPNRCGSFRG